MRKVRQRQRHHSRCNRLRLETLEPRVVLSVVISEIQASNDTTLADEENDFEDWIELHNTDAEPVNLGGWYLTDRADELTKWRMPDVTLEADEFLIVFASNKDSNDPDSTLDGLHTNFRLAADGEFLALVQPDGETIANAFSPKFPPQLTDQSYGLAEEREIVHLVNIAAPVTTLVPVDDSLGAAWTEIGFDDSNWQGGTAAIGFEKLSPGFSAHDDFAADLGPTWTVDIPADGKSTFMVDDEKLKVDVPSNQDVIDGRGLAPLFLQDAPQLNSNYEIITQVNLPSGSGSAGLVVTSGTARTPVFRLEFNRLSSFISQIQTIASDRVLNSHVDFNRTSVFLRIERDPFADIWKTSYKKTANDPWQELFAGTGESAGVPLVSSSEIGLIARTPTGGGSGQRLSAEFDFFEVNVEEERAVYSPGTGIDVESSMFGNNASIFARVPFTFAGDPSRMDQLDMAVSYDDGFIAYLNGVEVVRRFAPVNASWDSAASDSHGAVRGHIPTEVINLNAHLGLLTEGDNVLAFQGMNVASDDADFYLLPELSAAEIISTSPQVFLTPTPGVDNSLPAAPQPIFSEADGTFTGSQVVEISVPGPAADFEIRYTTDGTPPSERSMLYTGPLTLTESTWLRAKVFDSSIATAFLPSNTTAASYIAFDESLADRDSDIPILVIDTLGESFPSTDSRTLLPGLVSLFDRDPTTGRTTLVDNFDYSGLGGFRRRGASTGGNAKPSLKFETWGGLDDDLDVSLLGMPANSDWVLYAPYTFDRTLIHEPFIFSLSNEIGRYAPRAIPIEVFANTRDGVVDGTDYYGVYILIEKIKQDEGRVEIAAADANATYDPDSSLFDQPDPAITGGYLWEIDRSEPGMPPFNAGGASIHWRYPAHPNDPGNAPKVTDDQQAYATAYFDEFNTVLNGPSAYDPVEGYAKYIEVDSWIDHHLLNVITMNVNAQRLSAYFHKDVSGKIEFGPIWDFDRAMESADSRDDDPTQWRGQGGDRGTDFFGESGNGSGGLWWRQLFDDPNFFQRYIDRYHELRQTEFSDAAIDARIDFWADQVRESSDRNLNDVGSAFRVPPRSGGCHGAGEVSLCDGSWQGEVENMRAWLRRRLHFMDDTFPVVPTVSLNGEAIPVLPEEVLVTPGTAVTGFVPDKPAPPPQVVFDDVVVLLSGEPGSVPITYFVPGDNSLGDTWAAKDFDDALWDSGTNGIGYQNASINDFTDLITTTIKPTDVVNRAATIMTRTEFTVADPADLDELVLQIKYDDAFVAYLNGSEVARRNILTEPSWNQGSVQQSNQSAVVFEDINISAFKDLVLPGDNVLAIQVINGVTDALLDLGIADMLLLPQLVSRTETILPPADPDPGGTIYYTLDGSDPRGLDGQPSLAAAELGRDDSIVIAADTQVIIRNLDELDHGPESDLVTTDWSAPITYHLTVVEPPLGDLNADGFVDAADIDLLFGAIRTGNMSEEFDLDQSETVDQDDVRFLVEDVLGTFLGDANLDGKVNAADLNQVGINWRTDEAGWSDGDFTGDAAVNGVDLNLVGSNWRRGDAAVAVAGERLPHAAFAFPAPDITEIDLVRIASEERASVQEASSLSSSRPYGDGFYRSQQVRNDSSRLRRGSVRPIEALELEDIDDAILDDLFANSDRSHF